jgi:hypothetical protein
MGLIATKAIAQEDNRRVALDFLSGPGFAIYRAVADMPWPGTAAVHVCKLHIRKGEWSGLRFLDENKVSRISSGLVAQQSDRPEPFELATLPAEPSKGTTVNGTGFILSVEEATTLLNQAPENGEVIRGYLNGAQLNDSANGIGPKFIIDFGDLDREQAQRYSGPWQTVKTRVAAGREIHRLQVHEKQYWKFSDKRPDLYRSLHLVRRAILFSLVSKHFAFAFAPANQLFSSSLGVIPSADAALFGTLQSAIHLSWAHAYKYSLETRPRYSIGRCFRTFPFPDLEAPFAQSLREISEEMHQARVTVMEKRGIGLRRFYDAIHDPGQQEADIADLRLMHTRIDQIVLALYGWANLDLDHGFYKTKEGVCYTISDAAHREVLDRLLALNHQRHVEEEAELRAQPTRTIAKRGRMKRDAHNQISIEL